MWRKGAGRKKTTLIYSTVLLRSHGLATLAGCRAVAAVLDFAATAFCRVIRPGVNAAPGATCLDFCASSLRERCRWHFPLPMGPSCRGLHLALASANSWRRAFFCGIFSSSGVLTSMFSRSFCGRERTTVSVSLLHVAWQTFVPLALNMHLPDKPCFAFAAELISPSVRGRMGVLHLAKPSFFFCHVLVLLCMPACTLSSSAATT